MADKWRRRKAQLEDLEAGRRDKDGHRINIRGRRARPELRCFYCGRYLGEVERIAQARGLTLKCKCKRISRF